MACFLGLVSLHCGAEDASSGIPDSSGSVDGSNPELNQTDLRVDEPTSRGAGSGLHALCGTGDCLPDDPAACSGLGGAGGASQADAEWGGLAGMAGGVSFDPGDLGSTGNACRVVLSSCEGSDCPVQRACRGAGAALDGEPCVNSADCSASLACVGEGGVGVCRPYCCEGTAAACSADSFCDERPLQGGTEAYVPVCIPVSNCSLTAPFPCDGSECECQAPRACVVVRNNGATGCAVPGAGRAGDACTGDEGDECAHGFVCSAPAGCMQLCSTTALESGCPEGSLCHSLTLDSIAGFGVCVGVSGSGDAAR